MTDAVEKGRLYQFKCACKGGGESPFSGCGLISDGAVLVAEEGDYGTPQMRLVVGWFRGAPGAPEGQFCELAEEDEEDFEYWDGLGDSSRRVFVDARSLIPLEDNDNED